MNRVRRSRGRLVRAASLAASAALLTAGVVAVRHLLETPQPLTSPLPGESLLHPWRHRQVFYKALGPVDAPALVLLHTPAIGASAYEMRHLLEPLARSYRVYAPDLPGFGLSDRPGIEYDADLYVTFLSDFLTGVVKKPATLVASGVSCNYAVAVAATAPELCERLALLSPVALHGLATPLPSLLSLLNSAPAELLLYPLLSTRAAFDLTRARRSQAGEEGASAETDAVYANFYATTHQPGAARAPMALLAGRLSADTFQQFEQLRQPTLVIWGARALNAARTFTRDSGAVQPGAQPGGQTQIELIRDAGQYAHEENPEAVLEIFQQWQTPAEQATPSSSRPEKRSADDAASTATPAAEPPALPSAEMPAENATPAATETVAPASPVTAPAPAEPPAQEAASDAAETSAGTRVIEAYCVKCKQKREMNDAHKVTLKNGRAAVRGVCAVCGATIMRMGQME